MAFEGLTEKLTNAFKKLRGKGRLTESDVKEAMREIRMALLEADVSYKVVKDFVARVSERAVGSDVLESLTPAQMIVKIVNEELTALMGGEEAKLNLSSKSPTIVMMVGLQGAGKTTNSAQLAGLMLVMCTAPLPLSNWKSWENNWIFPFSKWDRFLPLILPKPLLNTQKSMVMIWFSWIRPVGFISMRL